MAKNPNWQEYARHYNTGNQNLETSPEYDAYLVKMFPPGVSTVMEWKAYVDDLKAKARNSTAGSPAHKAFKAELKRFNSSVSNTQTHNAYYGKRPKGWKGSGKPAGYYTKEGWKPMTSKAQIAYKKSGLKLDAQGMIDWINNYETSHFKPRYSPGEVVSPDYDGGPIYDPKYRRPLTNTAFNASSGTLVPLIESEERAKMGLAPRKGAPTALSANDIAHLQWQKEQQRRMEAGLEPVTSPNFYTSNSAGYGGFGPGGPSSQNSSPSYNIPKGMKISDLPPGYAERARAISRQTGKTTPWMGADPSKWPTVDGGRGGGRASSTPAASSAPANRSPSRSAAPTSRNSASRTPQYNHSGYWWNPNPLADWMHETTMGTQGPYDSANGSGQEIVPPPGTGMSSTEIWNWQIQKAAENFFRHYGILNPTAADYDAYKTGKIPPSATQATPPGWKEYVAAQAAQQQAAQAGGAGGGVSGSGADNSAKAALMKELTDQYWDAYKQARSANERRYQQILREYGTLENVALAGLDTLGNRERDDLNRRYNNQATQVAQNMVTSGLAGTTVAPTMQGGVERERSAQLRYMDDELARLKTDYRTKLAGERLGFMERREDSYPDLTQLMALAQGAGASGPAYMPQTVIQSGANSLGYKTVQPSQAWQKHVF